METAAPAYCPDDMRHLVSTSFCSMEYRVVPNRTSPLTGQCGAGFGGASGVSVFRHEGRGKRVGRRDSVHIRANWVDDFVISMPISAHVRTRQRGFVADIEAGSFVLLSTSKPFDAELTGTMASETFSLMLVRIPGSILRERVPLIDSCCGKPIQTGPGAGNIMRGLFDLAISDGPALSATEERQFGNMLLSSIASVATGICEQVDRDAQTPATSERIRQQAVDYIHANLSNPDLCSDKVAQHCRISTRYLQMIFAASDLTVESFVRDCRLARCREHFRVAQLADKSIIEIAMNWGFNDAAHFSRAYKARFGVTPSQERQRAIAASA